MASHSDVLCHRCGFPVRRGRIPIIWPSGEGKNRRAVFCSLDCLEATNGGHPVYTEPLESIHRAAEER